MADGMKKIIYSFLGFLLLSNSSVTAFDLEDYGADLVNYKQYGTFEDVGTENYRYVIKDRIGLARDAGMGVFPNTAILKTNKFETLKQSGKLNKTHWDLLNSPDYEIAFYKWNDAPESQGVKLFYRAELMKKAALKTKDIDYKLLRQAVKTYYALALHFPETVSYTFWQTPWYPAVVALDTIYYLARTYPKLDIELQGAYIDVESGFNDNVQDDVFVTDPGELFLRNGKAPRQHKASNKVIKSQGDDQNKLVQYADGHWQFFHMGEPILIKAVAYSPAKIGLSPDLGNWNTFRDWLFMDTDENGVLDINEVWMDFNRNNKKDPNEKTVSEFELMHEMGTNAIRMYHHGHDKKQLKEIYEKYGIGYLMGDFLGMYTIGSGAAWYEGTDYTNKKHKKNMLASLKKMVDEFKDEPSVYMWVLGNENNYGVVGDENYSGQGCMAKNQPDDYYKFVNEAARYVKKLDPHKRPVAICNGDLIYLDYYAKHCPDVDVFGVNAYRGPQGFGHSFWRNIRRMSDDPVVVTEYGCPAYGKNMTITEAEEAQAEYLKGTWQDIEYNSWGYGQGNALGGVSFEWVDEWWKGGTPPQFSPLIQETEANFTGPFPDGSFYEEWLGVVSQGDGSDSPFLRQPRKAFYMYKELWNK